MPLSRHFSGALSCRVWLPPIHSPLAGNDAQTSLVFTLDEGSGMLFKALSVFALRDINITKIESRPMRTNPIVSTTEGDRQFNYLFYLDHAGHVSELKCKQAIRHLQELTPFFKVLGSYPVVES